MLSFFVLWSLVSSLCYVIAIFFAREIIVSKLPFGLVTIAFILIIIVYWVLLGLLQCKLLLDAHLPNANIWRLTTIFGGTISSILVVAGFSLAFYFTFKTMSPVGFGTSSSRGSEFDSLFALCSIIIASFSAGFTFGLAQKLVLQHSVSSSYLNYMPFVSGFSWLLISPIFGFSFLSFAKYNFFSYLLITTICTFFIYLIEGLIIQNALNIS